MLTKLFLRGFAAACASAALLSACGGGQDPDDKAFDDSSTASTSPAPAPAAASSASAAVVFHMTGLMLVVPSAGGGGQTHVLLPKVKRHPDPHVARFGFGLPVRDSQLCVTHRAGICYVDLTRWRLEPIGTGLEPAQSRPFPDTIANVTRATGAQYRVKLDTPEDSLVARVRFGAGTLGEMPCSLAQWRYTPVGEAEKTAPFANAITWEINHPRTSPLTLRFVRKSDGLTRNVALGTTVSGRVHVLLAHVPVGELPYLPPGRPTQAPNDQEPLHHMHDFYDRLRDQSGRPAVNRPVPEFNGGIRTSCPVLVTTFNTQKKLAPLARDGVKTYGCIITTGDS